MQPYGVEVIRQVERLSEKFVLQSMGDSHKMTPKVASTRMVSQGWGIDLNGSL